MRVYAVADIHAKPGRIDRVRSAVADYSPDVVVVAGDINNYANPHAAFGPLDSLGVPVLAVRGNTDLSWHERCFYRYANIASLHLRRMQIRGIPFTGISGTVPVPFRSRIRFFEKALLRDAARNICTETVLVVHPPPYGTLDRVLGRLRAGSRGVATLVSACSPKVVLCGHIHEDAGAIRLGGTLVVNCSMGRSGSGAVLDFGGVDEAGYPAVGWLARFSWL